MNLDLVFKEGNAQFVKMFDYFHYTLWRGRNFFSVFLLMILVEEIREETVSSKSFSNHPM